MNILLKTHFLSLLSLTVITLSGNLFAEELSSAVETLRPINTVTNSRGVANNYNYVEYLPEGYSQSSNWPIVFFLHGSGECLKRVSLTRLGDFGPNHWTRMGNKLPMIILSPQSPSSWKYSDLEAFREFVFTDYKIDPKRFYLTGLSLGGLGTSSYLNSTFGSQVAAAIPICPAAFTLTGANLIVKNNIPIWAAQAKDDPSAIRMFDKKTGAPLSNKYMLGAFNNLSVALGGTTNFTLPHFSSPSVTFTAHFDKAKKQFVWTEGQQVKEGVPPFFCTIYGSGGHVIWNRMYESPEVYAWLLKQSKP